MIRKEKQITEIVWVSSVHSEIETSSEDLSSVIQWADKNPVIWKIVMGTKSQAFGKKSSLYMGYQRGEGYALERAERFRSELGVNSFFGWCAKFTLEHYEDKNFKSGFFQQWDGRFDRGCAYLDYTTKTLDQVIEKFLEWCDLGYKFPTREVRLDKKIVRKFPPEGK